MFEIVRPTNSFFLLFVILCVSCGPNTADQPLSTPQAGGTQILQTGPWRLVFDLGNDELPIQLNISQTDGLHVDFINAEERINAYECRQVGDSLYIRMPLFDSEFCGVISHEGSHYQGLWRNYARVGGYTIPFSAEAGPARRFEHSNSSFKPVDLPESWEVHFSPNHADDHYSAIGLFHSEADSERITGTFITETGDYRYLEGDLHDSVFSLSCFDGSHAFLFTAHWDGNELSHGVFKSGTHWEEPWHAQPNPDFQLRDPNHITQITDTTLFWNARFLNHAGDSLQLSELALAHKLSVIQIMGSWCPNCIDESRELEELYTRYHDRGLAIIPVAFENTEDHQLAFGILDELQKDLQLSYPIYYGGKKSKQEASRVFPALTEIRSFPTTILIDSTGQVHGVHTGFYGPSTGRYYEHWKHDIEKLIDQLLPA